MPCMCGDICCPSCGPAQGNFRCNVCGAWASDETCECTPEQIEAAARAEYEADQAYAEALREDADLAEQYADDLAQMARESDLYRERG